MNERINELKSQCIVREQRGTNAFDSYVVDRFDTEKFAELIVAECLGIVKSNTYGPAGEYDYSYTDEKASADERAETIYKDITYRFGVEE